jgi:uncharacterized protein
LKLGAIARVYTEIKEICQLNSDSLYGFFWLTLVFLVYFNWKGSWAILTGYEGIFCGASAIYCAMAQVLNESYGRVVLPLGDKK